VIFSRGRGNERRRSRDERGDGGLTGRQTADSEPDADDTDPDDVPEFGPYDVTQVPKGAGEWLDLGALRIPATPGVEIHIQAGPEGQIQQIMLQHGQDRLQLGAFAAPRSEGIWDEVRTALTESLRAGGARPEEIEGDYGPELRARIRDGSTTTEVRHIGVDGPRWFVHGIFIGPAADPAKAGILRDVLRGLVVDRGTEARPVSEALPLRLPPEAAAQLSEQAAQDQHSEAT
jgi:hypothetical protein